jgi:N-acetyl-anhydromuramyl-L-alanine amidase AmpD
MEETLFARHVIGLNYCSIGVENVGSKDKPLTQEQIEANIALVKYLSSKFDIEYLIGHSEYIKFRQTDLWKETNPKYVTYKYDPGDNFMKEVRKGLIGFNLKSEP